MLQIKKSILTEEGTELSEDQGFGAVLGFFLELWDCLFHSPPAGEILKVCGGAFLSSFL